MAPKRKKQAATTLDDLDGAVSKRVSFIRTDAVAVKSATPSKTRLKETFASALEPQWTVASEDLTAQVLSLLSRHALQPPDHAAEAALASSDSGSTALRAVGRAAGIYLGRSAVCRALRQGAVRAIAIAHHSGPPLLYAHVAALVQTTGTPAALLACSSAQLGQPFGLLRASVVGLSATSFGDDHELVCAIRRAGCIAPMPWLATSGQAHGAATGAS